MSDEETQIEASHALRLRSAAAMTDYQMQRAARDAAKMPSHAHLSAFRDLRELLPWAKAAA